MSQTLERTPETTPTARRMRRGGTVVAAAAAALAVWVIAVPVIGLELEVGTGSTEQTVGPIPVVVIPLVAGAAAWGLLALLERTARRGRLVWRIVGWAVLALSLLGPLTMAAGGALVALLAMHLVVGIVLVLGLGGGPASR